MTEEIFKAASRDAGDDWLLCFGNDNRGETWYVVTNHLQATEAMEYVGSAKEDAELVARLMNWYYSNTEKAEDILSEEKKDSLICPYCGGVLIQSDDRKWECDCPI